jgi:glutathione S-transferase
VPVLVCGGRVWSDSSDIVDYADSRAPEHRKLFPEDPAEAAGARTLEREFDERLGPHGRRWMYHGIRRRRDLVLRYGPTGVPAWQRRALPFAWPVAARVIDRYLDITPETADESLREVWAVFGEVAERLADGRPYLLGERFTAADLTFASLAAAVVMPPEYGVPLPGPEELPAEMAAVVRDLRDHPAGRHALAMFRRERGRSG